MGILALQLTACTISKLNLKVVLRCIFSKLELDAGIQIRNNDIIHAGIHRTLRGPTSEAQMVLDENVGDDHFDGMLSKEAPGADNLAVAKMQVILARGREFCIGFLAD